MHAGSIPARASNASEKCTVDELARQREINADRALKSSGEMGRRFVAYLDTLRASVDIAEARRFGLGESTYKHAHERMIDDMTAQQAPERLTAEAAA